jgi:hypothetical protein
MTRRLLLTLLIVGAVGAAVPALAALTSHRAAAQPQISINTAVPAFQVAGLLPGDYMVRCLRVRNEGAEPIRLTDAASLTGDLAPYLSIAVERGTGLGDVGPSCAGFVPAGGDRYAFGTKAGGVPAAGLTPEVDPSWANGATAAKSFRITILMLPSAPLTAADKSGTATFAFAGTPLTDTTGGDPTGGDGTAIAPGTTGGLDKNGNFIPNKTVKKRFRMGTPVLLHNGDVRVRMIVPAGGAIRAKVRMANGLYAHRLYKVVLPDRFTVLLHPYPKGTATMARYRRAKRTLDSVVSVRYRWAHGDAAYLQPQKKLRLVRGRG